MQTEAEVIAELRAVLQECREAANRDLEAKRVAERELERAREIMEDTAMAARAVEQEVELLTRERDAQLKAVEMVAEDPGMAWLIQGRIGVPLEKMAGEIERLRAALTRVIIAHRYVAQVCRIHKPLRVPMCPSCQLDARIEEAHAVPMGKETKP